MAEVHPPVMGAQLPLGFEEQRPPKRRPRSFHVRSHMTVDEVTAGEAKAQGQDAAILEWFRGRARGRFTPSEVAADFPAWPLTSVRRSLTGLTRRGHLQHYPAERRPGPRGARESTWGLA